MWFVYESLLCLGLLLVYVPMALIRRRLPHRGWFMRCGRYPPSVREALTAGGAIWVHAVSVGEVRASELLVQQLRGLVPQAPVVLSTITPSGFAVASQQLAPEVIPVYFPLDVRVCVRRALATVRPRLLLLLESEFWPTMVRLTKARGTPIAVVNGRISAGAYARYGWARRWVRRTLREVDLFLMQTQADADRATALGAPPERVLVTGSLKWESSLQSRPTLDEIRQTARQAGLDDGATVLVAGSTHRGEEQALLQAFRAVRAVHRQARLIIAPRHLERLDEVEGLIRQTGLSSARLSRASSGAWDVGLVDTFGQLMRYYGLASLVFVGGSLIPHGGQNPAEPAGLGRPILFGPSMQNFHEMAEQLLSHQAARQIADSRALAQACLSCLSDRASAEAMGARARALTERSAGSTQRTLDALQRFF